MSCCAIFSNGRPTASLTPQEIEEKNLSLNKKIFFVALVILTFLFGVSHLMTYYQIPTAWQLLPALGILAMIPLITKSGFYLHKKLSERNGMDG